MGKDLEKKILVGSLLIVILLLLMPSIPAIQHKAAKYEILSKITEDLDIKDIREIFELGKLDRIKHPFLYVLVISSLAFRNLRIEVLAKYSFKEDWPYMEITNPVLFLRFLILVITTLFWSGFWEYISDTLGWGWVIPF